MGYYQRENSIFPYWVFKKLQTEKIVWYTGYDTIDYYDDSTLYSFQLNFEKARVYYTYPDSLIYGITIMGSLFGVFKLFSYLLLYIHMAQFLKECEKQVQLDKDLKKGKTDLQWKK